ncbi:MAG: DUF4288 domain-containing protein [Flavobacteriales bacterium]|nr:DUF4288 domain-containing protein [Flavobacteriales bacterium]
MNWYSARLIFQIRIHQNGNAEQFDESVRLFHAINEEEALIQAREAGMADETSFINVHGERVLWKFIDVNMIHELGAIQPGVEVFSNTRMEDKPNHFISAVRTYTKKRKSGNPFNRTITVE